MVGRLRAITQTNSPSSFVEANRRSPMAVGGRWTLKLRRKPCFTLSHSQSRNPMKVRSREKISCVLRPNRLLPRAARHAHLTEPGPEGTPLGSDCARSRHLVNLLFRGPLRAVSREPGSGGPGQWRVIPRSGKQSRTYKHFRRASESTPEYGRLSVRALVQ
jgi:hypothetical protein